MGALRTRMIEEMKLRNFSPRTQQSYLAAVIGLVKHYRRSPDQLTQDEIRAYLLHLQNLSAASCSTSYRKASCVSVLRLFGQPAKKQALTRYRKLLDPIPALPQSPQHSAKDLLLKITAETNSDGTLKTLQAASCTYRIALGPRAGYKVLRLQSLSSIVRPSSAELRINAHGFSLHAAVRWRADQRKELEQLCRYITRPAIANERIKRNRAGQVVLQQSCCNSRVPT
jgi:integrase-like protein/putative transposase